MGNKSYLIFQLTKKDIEAKYKGSILGLLWSFINPVIMLIIYTLVFSEIFQAKWSVDTDNKFAFALILFSGLNIINMINDVMNRSTTLIASNTSYVKKIIFPLEILPLTIVFSNLFNCIIGYLILIFANLFLNGHISPTLWLLPVALLPFVIFSIGVSYIVSSVSVYFRDMSSIMAIITVLIMYMSPVFFPLEAVPAAFSFVCRLNPLTFIIENIRNVTLYGTALNLTYWILSVATSLLFLFVGYTVFKKLREGFSDIL